MYKKMLLSVAASATLLAGCDVLQSALSSAATSSSALSNTQIIQGLKEALNQGVTKGVSALNVTDGFFGNAALKILFPPQAQKVEKTLRDVGLGRFADDAVLKMNRAAEDAAGGAKDIFITAITGMTVNDAMSILMGEKNACTQYLKNTCSAALYQKMQPVIKTSLDKVGAARAWTEVVTQYNKIPLVQKQNPSLDDHVTNKATDGIFSMVEKEEANIRVNPLQRGTELMKKVFAKQDK
jgi:Protein of unknown function (DUF4197)